MSDAVPSAASSASSPPGQAIGAVRRGFVEALDAALARVLERQAGASGVAAGGRLADAGVAETCARIFDAGVAARRRGAAAVAETIEMALVPEDELDDLLAVDVLRERIEHKHAEGWQALDAAAGFPHEAGDETAWPRIIADAVGAGARKAGLDPRWRGALLQLFQDELAQRVGGLSTGAAAVPRAVRRAPQPESTAPQAAPPARPEEEDAASMQALLDKIGRGEALEPEPAQAAGGLDIGNTLALLRNLSSAAAGGWSADTAASMQAVAVRQAQALDQADPHGQYAQAVDRVGRAFSFIHADSLMPDRGKAALLQLQLPYLRVALSEAQAFGDEGHPARRLLECMAGVARTGRPEALVEVEALVDAVLAEDAPDGAQYARWLADWEPRATRAAQARRLAETRAVAAQKAHEMRETARRQVRKDLAAWTHDVTDARVRVALDDLGQAMFLSLLRENGLQGRDYQAWLGVLRRAGEAGLGKDADGEAMVRAWTVLGVGDEEAHQRLAALFDNAGAALQRVGEAWAGQAEEPAIGGGEPARADSGQAEDPVTGGEEPAGAGDGQDPGTPLAEAEATPVVDARPAPAADGVLTQAADGGAAIQKAWTVGIWIELRSASVAIAAKLSWKSAFTGKWLLVSTHGLRVDTLSEDELSERLRTGRARLLPEGMQPNASLFG